MLTCPSPDSHLFAALHARMEAEAAADFRESIAEKEYARLIADPAALEAEFNALCEDDEAREALLVGLAGVDLCEVMQARGDREVRIAKDVLRALYATLNARLIARSDAEAARILADMGAP